MNRAQATAGPQAPGGRASLVGLLVLTVAAFVVRLRHLAAGGEPPGTDGYYYVVQAADLGLKGQLHVPDSSWMLQLPGLLVRAGLDPVLSVVVVASALAAAVVPAAWLLGDRSGGRPAAWMLAVWAAGSPALTTLAAEFGKNLAFAAPMLLAFAGLAGAGGSIRSAPRKAGSFPPEAGSAPRETRPVRRRAHVATVLVGAALAATAHRVGAGWVLLSGAGAATGALSGQLSRRLQLLPKWTLPAAFGLLAAFLVASSTLPGLLHPADLDRLAGQFDAPRWPVAPWCWFALKGFAAPLRGELALAWPALLGAAWLVWTRPADRMVVLALAAPLAAAVLVPWRKDVLDIGFRLSLVTPLASVPLLVMMVARVAEGVAARRAVAAVIVGCLLVAPWTSRSGYDPADRPPHHRYRLVIAAVPEPLPELLIAHTGINFLYDHLTGEEAMAWAPEPELDPTTVGRLAWGIRPGEWSALVASGGPAPVRLDADYTYVREDVWRGFVAAAAVEAREADAAGDRAAQMDSDGLAERVGDWRNPSRVRPASLVRNRGR